MKIGVVTCFEPVEDRKHLARREVEGCEYRQPADQPWRFEGWRVNSKVNLGSLLAEDEEVPTERRVPATGLNGPAEALGGSSERFGERIDGSGIWPGSAAMKASRSLVSRVITRRRMSAPPPASA